MKLRNIAVIMVCVLTLGIGASYTIAHSTKERSKKDVPLNTAKADEVKKNNEKTADMTKKEVSEEKKDRTFKNESLIYNDKGIPVLMYHSIDYEKDNPLRIPKEQFRGQMKYLKDNGYTTLTLNELYSFFENNMPVPDKSVALVFDDGYADNYINAFPIIKEFGFKATVFVITDTVDKSGAYLNSTQLKEMDAYGFDVESHTLDHEELNKQSYAKQLNELKESKLFLEKLLNKQVNYLAYPVGKYNKETIKAAKEAGYKMAFTTNGTWSDKSDGMYTLDRVYISAESPMSEFIRRLTNRNYNK